MRLKKLQVYGFKSFADSTEFQFEPGVTAVVGPNGCGKSNVVDAIKWILGEQSAKSLRGKDMLDVIFNGSGSRKSLGFAEASLVFEDLQTAEGKTLSEVQITRRLYRSGESEYMMNQEGCRLRDIKDLFLDTGVGMQAYSIIEQGRIDAILTRSAQERRAIFEEAAGISRYKRKKLEAERKLERTDGNLLRVGDRIEEIERRLRSLKSQASKARRYREHEARLKELRVRHSLHQYAGLVEELAALREQVAITEREVESKREAAALFEAEALQQEALVREIEAQLEDLSRARSEVDLRIAQAAGEMEYGEAMIAEIEHSTAANTREIATIEGHNQTDQKEFEQLQGEHARAHAEAQAARATLEQARSEETALAAGISERRREADLAGALLAELTVRRAENRDQLTQLVAQQEAATLHRERLEANRLELESEVERLKGERETQDSEVSRLAEFIGETTRAYHDREEAARAAEQNVEQLGDMLGRASELYHSRLSRQEVLQGLVDRREGMETGAQQILAAAKRGLAATATVCGQVADIVEMEPEHYAAVEAALEHEAETIVCRDHDGVARVARYLTGGKAKLVAADRLGRPELSPDLTRALTESGVLGDLRSRVRAGRFATDGAAARAATFGTTADGRFAAAADGCFTPVRPLSTADNSRLAGAVLDDLLGNVLLVEGTGDVDAAARAQTLAARYPRLSFVTADGTIAARAALAVTARTQAARPTAADSGPAGGLIAQRNELRRLSDLVEEQARLVEEAKTLRSLGAAQLAAVDEELQRLRGEIYDANIEQSEKRAAYRHFGEGIHTRRRELDALHETLLGATDELSRLQARAQSMEVETASLASEIEAAEARSEHLKEEIAKQVARREELGEDMRSMEVAMTRASEQTSSLARAMRGIEAAIIERKGRIDRIRLELAQSSAKIETAREKIQLASERKLVLSGERKSLEARSAEVAAGRDQARARIEEVRAEVRLARQAVERAGEELGQLRLRESEARVHRDALVERVRDEYGLELEALLARLRGLPAPEPVPADSGSESPATEEAAAPADEREAAFLASEGETDWAAVDAEIQDLKLRMANMGNVNLEAIEEYDEVEKRFGELAGQRDDLVLAKAKLAQLIEELNVKSRDLFLTTLETVRENFKDMFRKLFGGGNGDIVLGEGDPLDAGIEIIAKPPGKEPANISLLSGGEKSMTAVALLFALFKSRPSPFCILDEVDAALDEANVTRFVGMLKEFLEGTQFIIITHNKRTMSVADAIHGVTMQESGVSKRISVKFEEVA